MGQNVRYASGWDDMRRATQTAAPRDMRRDVSTSVDSHVSLLSTRVKSTAGSAVRHREEAASHISKQLLDTLRLTIGNSFRLLSLHDLRDVQTIVGRVKARVTMSIRNVVSEGVKIRSFTPTVETSGRTIPRVQDQYPKFSKKRRRVAGAHISVSTLRGNSEVQTNYYLSLMLNQPEGEELTAPTSYPPTTTRVVELSVGRKDMTFNAGGITFTCGPGGMVIPLPTHPRHMESLHVRVTRVDHKSEAKRLEITPQMWLRSLAIVDTRTKPHTKWTPTIIGATGYRHHVLDMSAEERDESMWRAGNSSKKENQLDLDKIISLVDAIMCRVYRRKHTKLCVELIEFKMKK